MAVVVVVVVVVVVSETWKKGNKGHQGINECRPPNCIICICYYLTFVYYCVLLVFIRDRVFFFSSFRFIFVSVTMRANCNFAILGLQNKYFFYWGLQQLSTCIIVLFQKTLLSTEYQGYTQAAIDGEY